MSIIVSRANYNYVDIAKFIVKHANFFMKVSKNRMNLSNKFEINK